VRSVQSADERERVPVGGDEGADVSVANNLPGGGGGAEGGNNFATIEKSDQTTNYEISKTIKNQISESGIVKKLSIGILVDGKYTTDPVSKKDIYNPRPKEELDKIANLVKVAVGFSEDRNDKIEVVNMEFSMPKEEQEAEEENWLRDELPNLFQTLVFAVVILLILITVIRPIALKAFEVRSAGGLPVIPAGAFSPPSDAAVAAASAGSVVPGDGLGGDGLVDAPRPEKQMGESVTLKLNELVVKNTQETVSVLRKWLNENN
jgi:flagellar M-ring protein FliF